MKKLENFFLNTIVLMNVLLFSCCPALADSKDLIANLVKPNSPKEQLKSSPLFTGRGDGITTCPVTGEKITSKKLKAELYGRTVYFCCHGCLKAGLKTPDKFIKPTQAEQQQAVKAFLAKAQAVHAEEFCDE